MSDSSPKPWSTSPNAPQIPRELYVNEKTNLYGNFAAAILYGIIILLFFRCMNSLLNPVNRAKGGVKWGLLIHTVAMFAFVTIVCCMNFDVQSIAYIDDREYPGDTAIPPGPFGYQLGPLYRNPLNIVPGVLSFFNLWLADGLLLYRCYVIYAMNYWVIVSTSLVYLAVIVTSIITAIQNIDPSNPLNSTIQFYLICYPMSLALTILLTLMIIARLALHGSNMRKVTGTGANANGLYSDIVTMFVESYSLYTISFIVWIALQYVGNPVRFFFSPVFAETQVITPYLVILRVANRRALTSNDIASGGNVDSFRFVSQGESTNSSGTTPEESYLDSTGTNGETAAGQGSGVENTIGETSLQ